MEPDAADIPGRQRLKISDVPRCGGPQAISRRFEGCACSYGFHGRQLPSVNRTTPPTMSLEDIKLESSFHSCSTQRIGSPFYSGQTSNALVRQKKPIVTTNITIAARKKCPSFPSIDRANRPTVTAGTVLVKGTGNGRQSSMPHTKMQNPCSRQIVICPVKKVIRGRITFSSIQSNRCSTPSAEFKYFLGSSWINGSESISKRNM
jgi:hypothetical protein